MIHCVGVVVLSMLLTQAAGAVWAAERSTFAGPAMGTTYRVTLARPRNERELGKLHREVDQLLAKLDQQLSTWRNDSDVSRFNQADAGVWVDVGNDLFRVVQLAQELHHRTGGRFDITVGPLVPWWQNRLPGATTNDLLSTEPPRDLLARVGSRLIESRPARENNPAAIRKRAPGVEIDLSAIGPGYAVDEIGEQLVGLGSVNHLVELGGEVRAWGRRADGNPWRVAVQAAGTGGAHAKSIELADGRAVAVAAASIDRPVIDPRTGRIARNRRPSDPIIYADSCAEVDALATATMLPE